MPSPSSLRKPSFSAFAFQMPGHHLVAAMYWCGGRSGRRRPSSTSHKLAPERLGRPYSALCFSPRCRGALMTVASMADAPPLSAMGFVTACMQHPRGCRDTVLLWICLLIVWYTVQRTHESDPVYRLLLNPVNPFRVFSSTDIARLKNRSRSLAFLRDPFFTYFFTNMTNGTVTSRASLLPV